VFVQRTATGPAKQAPDRGDGAARGTLTTSPECVANWPTARSRILSRLQVRVRSPERAVSAFMNIRFYRFLDRYIGAPICAVLSAIHRFRRRPVGATPPRRILVILLSEMGTMVLAYPMLARLKQQYPGVSLHILIFTRNREAIDLLGVIPAENVLTLDDHSLSHFALGALQVLRILRALKLDVVIDCELFARVSSIFSYVSGAPVSVGFHRHTQEGLYRGSFLSRSVLYNPYRHISQQFLTLAAAIESGTVPAGKHVPSPIGVTVPTVAIAEAELLERITKLHAKFPALQGKSLVLIYASGGILPIRAWPLAYFNELCASLLKDGHAIGIIGLKQDAPLGQAIVAHCQDAHCVDLSGYTDSMRHLLALFHRASLLVANDGAPGQFAAVTEMPAIIFFGPETPVLYGPLSPNVHCLHLPLPCSPCLTAYNHRNSPCDGDNQCLKQITPEQVLAKARELLATQTAAGRRSEAR
jgi:ADP-heptose:LPS heptosyltransferase